MASPNPAANGHMSESDIDVLIVGAGPAGYMAAAWLTRFKGLRVRIVEKRDAKIFSGQADGLQCRTLEVLDSFGFADRVWKTANHMMEVWFWNPDQDGKIVRTESIPDVIPGLSRFSQVTIHQGYIERFFRDHLKKHGPLFVEHGVMPESLEIDESAVDDPDAYPVKVVLRHLTDEEASPEQFGHDVTNGLFRSTNLLTDEEEDEPLQHKAPPGSQEIVNCKYVIGCDGAHSWVRRQLGYKMEGEQSDYVWGVLDIIPLTNFPDIRHRCAIHSAESGSIMIIPREKGLVRFYIQLAHVERNANGLVDRKAITPEMILRAAQRIMAPYTLEYEYIDWFTAYQIGQRVAANFSAHERVFITGDACHTHSPKAGQGMNVSMMDCYNLGWKIGGVCKGLLQRSVLKTYETERKKIARELIEIDQKLAKLFSGRPAKGVADEGGVSLAEFKATVEHCNLFAMGIEVEYAPSNIVAEYGAGPDSDSHEGNIKALAKNIPVGRRLNSFKVLNQSDARPWHLQELLPSDGRWRIVVFAGNILDPAQKARVNQLAEYLGKPGSFLNKYTPRGNALNSVIQLLTVHSSPRIKVQMSDIPAPLRMEHDYDSVYVDDISYHEGHGEAYKNYGIDNETGCVVIVRPDQYVSVVCTLEETDRMEKLFEGCLISQKEF